MPKVLELLEERSNKVKAARAMIDKAEAENRAFTKAEDAEVDKLQAEAEGLNKRASNLQRQERNEAENALREERGVDGETNTENQGGANLPELRSASTGERLKVAGPGGSLLCPELRDRNSQEYRDNDPFPAIAAALSNDPRLLDRLSTEQRAAVVGLGSKGGYAATSMMSNIIQDLALNDPVLDLLGVPRVIMEAEETKFLVIESDPTPGCYGEGDTITTSDGSYGMKIARPHKVAVRTKLSIESIRFTANLEQIIRTQLTRQIQQKVQELYLKGDGDNSCPTGVFNNALVQTSSPGTLSMDEIIDQYYLVRAQNRTPTGAVLSTNVEASIVKLKDGEGQYLKAPEPVGSMPRHSTNTMADTEMLVGDFSQALLVMSPTIELEIGVAQNDFETDMRSLIARVFMDVVVLDGQGIVAATVAAS